MSTNNRIGDKIDLLIYVHDEPKGGDDDSYTICFWDTWGLVNRDSMQGNPENGDEISVSALITNIDDESGYVTLRFLDTDFDVFIEDLGDTEPENLLKLAS